MRIVTVFIAATLLGAPFGASLAQRGLAPPHVAVISLEPLPRMGAEQRFRAVFRVDNMNTEPLKLRGIEFSLRLAHQGLLDGRLPAMTIEALDQQVVTVELRSDLIASASQLLAFVEGPENTLPYEMVCKVTFERGKIDPVNFSTEGSVPVVMPAR
jgi:LEA14-like dessication related protein